MGFNPFSFHGWVISCGCSQGNPDQHVQLFASRTGRKLLTLACSRASGLPFVGNFVERQLGLFSESTRLTLLRKPQDRLQGGRMFSLSHPMGEGRGEGRPVFGVVFPTVCSSRIAWWESAFGLCCGYVLSANNSRDSFFREVRHYRSCMACPRPERRNRPKREHSHRHGIGLEVFG